MAKVYNTCLNPLVVDLVAGQLMTTSDAIEGGSPQILDLQNDTIIPADELPVPPSCDTGACSASGCPNGREIGYLSMITDVSVSGFGTNMLHVTMNEALYTNNEDGTTPAYTIDFGDGGAVVAITEGVPVLRGVGSLGTSYHKGTITETTGGATFQFWYHVKNNLVFAMQLRRITTPTIDMSCDLYPDYTIQVDDAVQNTNGTLAISASYIAIFNEIVNTETYGAGVYDINESGTLTTDLETPYVNDNIKATFTVSAPIGDVNNTGILRTQCIE